MDFFFDEIEYRLAGNLDVERLRTVLAFANEAQITSLHRVIQRFAAPKQTIYGDWPYAWSHKRFPDLDLKTIAQEIVVARGHFAGDCS